ncbi:hypothetical protein [Erythrobacter sp. YT30]|uniref:hypothetical protein n=1 Tax=Erythrobacter sp. YT30 TaxID=1735012 RepID=UPI0012E344DB|nr:hypothetical protein [Erythrobacter sp. YT30]
MSLHAILDRFPRIALISLVSVSVLLAPSDGLAQDGTPRERDKPREMPNIHYFTETPRRDTALQNFHFFVKVMGKDRQLWSGDLWLAEYDGARIEIDLQDINPKCSYEERRKVSRNSGLVLTLRSWDGVDGYGFWLRSYWTHRLPQCDELRNEISWISIPVELDEGETETFTGNSGLSVELTRQPWIE